MATLIVAGGDVFLPVASSYLKGRGFDHIIAVDAGVLAAEKLGLSVDYLVGDFDTLGEEKLAHWEKIPNISVKKYNPQKDDTDMEIAVKLALQFEEGKRKARGNLSSRFFPEQVLLIGATGTRLDHTLANISMLSQFETAGISACILDAHNRLSMHGRGFCLSKKELLGKYISFVAFTKEVSGITLKGFCYPLDGYTLRKESSRCISNEACGEELSVEFSEGELLMVESADTALYGAG